MLAKSGYQSILWFSRVFLQLEESLFTTWRASCKSRRTWVKLNNLSLAKNKSRTVETKSFILMFRRLRIIPKAPDFTNLNCDFSAAQLHQHYQAIFYYSEGKIVNPLWRHRQFKWLFWLFLADDIKYLTNRQKSNMNICCARFL